jgi:hypothetical protein
LVASVAVLLISNRRVRAETQVGTLAPHPK